MEQNIKKMKTRAEKSEILQLAYSILKGKYAKWYSWIKYSRKNNAAVEPTDIIYIDPENVNVRQLPHEDINNIPHTISAIKNGDWDKRVENIVNYDLYKSFKNRFQCGFGWEKTCWYQRIVENIKDGDFWYGCETEKEFLSHCESVDKLYNSIKENGYLSQKELINNGGGTHQWARYCPELHEVTINIGRAGNMIFQEGRHRFVISRLLNIREIPVRVKIRHSNWQVVRNKSQRGIDIGNFSHPDIP